MKDEEKTKEQLIEELAEMRQRIAELEVSEAARKRAEEVLRDSEEKYRTLVEQSLQALVVIQDFRIVFANPAFAELSGYTVEELLSFSPEEVRAMVHPEDQALVWGRFRDRLGGKPVLSRYEFRGIRKDGTVCWLEVFANRIEYDGLLAVQRTFVDITERKRAEEALRQRNRELTLLNRLGQELTATFDLQQLTERLLQTIIETIGAEAVSVWLWDEEQKSWLVCQAAFPPDQNRALVDLCLPPGQGIAGWVAREEKSAIVADVQGDPRFFPDIDEQTGFHTVSLLAVPLRARGKVTGVLEVVNKRDGDFDEDDRALVEMLAASAAIAIDNARLYVQAQQEIADRKQAEEALQYRLAFDQLVTNISTLFIQLAPGDLGSGIDFALRAIGKFTAVDRSYIFVFSDDGTKMDNTHEWCAEGILSQVENRRELPVQRFPWWMERLNRGQAVHIPRVADLPSEARAEKEFFESQGVQSLVTVPMIYGSSLVGFVGSDSVRVEKTWTEDIIALLKIVGEIFVNALERKRAEEQIRTALQEKEVLLKEIHHRVKNNLQIVSSLLDLQSDSIEDEQTRQILQDSRSRVKIMALTHERLYQTQDLARVDFAEYIQSLARDVFRSYRAHAAGVTLKANVEGVLLDIDTAIPCGLIINELASNALKYAFPDGREGEICVELTSDNGQFTLVVRDNGVGFPQDLDFRNTESLGLKLVVGLVRQLKGTIELYRDGGTEFMIKFAALERKRKGRNNDKGADSSC